MSKDNLGNKQTILKYSCLIIGKRYDLVITTQKQTM